MLPLGVIQGDICSPVVPEGIVLTLRKTSVEPSSAQVRRNKNEMKLCNHIFVSLVFSVGFSELVSGFLIWAVLKNG